MRCAQAFRRFAGAYQGMMTGSRFRKMPAEEIDRLMDKLFPKDEHVVAAAVPCPPLRRGDKEETRQLDVLLDGMKGRPFTMMLLADGKRLSSVMAERERLEKLYTAVSSLRQVSFSQSSNDSQSEGWSLTDSIGKTLNYGVSSSVSESVTQGVSYEDDDSASKKTNAQTAMQAAGAVTALIAAASPVGGGLNAMQMLIAANSGSSLGALASRAKDLVRHEDGEYKPASRHEDHAQTTGTQENLQEGMSAQQAQGQSGQKTQGTSQTCQFEVTDRTASGLLDALDQEISRLRQLEQESAFDTCAWFVAGRSETASTAAALFRSVYASGCEMDGSAPLLVFEDGETVSRITEYLRQGVHPQFRFENEEFMEVTAAQMIDARDLVKGMALPHRSISGLTATAHAPFARDVIRADGGMRSGARRTEIGCVVHMDAVDANVRIAFDTDRLTGHLFAAGTTGMGKSNFCYVLLEQLLAQQVNTLIIEPAKGEYAQVFGGREDFAVYGTNVTRAPMLRINPFAFPDGVTVSEHIERLLAIFSAAWPLYSAMPAILKEALERIYEDRGFDLMLGFRTPGDSFPCFDDLLRVLPQIISGKAYSAEVQGNYIGALVTRVQSLTNGVYSAVFSQDELGDEALFDHNVIIDISRVGSEETLALIMGVLIMRLSEYRMCSGGMNSGLRHVTLLEEAHHLLRAHAPGGAEGADMRRASVEMITTAIAEMRTYGEGFVIADQSPSLLERSVIRNTQTKVFFMLPDHEDVGLAASALSLSERQMAELSRLPRGVAAVRQSGWDDAVLCRMDHFTDARMKPLGYERDWVKESSQALSQAIAALVSGRLRADRGASVSLDMDRLRELSRLDFYPMGKKGVCLSKTLHDAAQDGLRGWSDKQKAQCLAVLLDAHKLFRRTPFEREMTIEQWADALWADGSRRLNITWDELQTAIVCILRIRAAKPEEQSLAMKYRAAVLQRIYGRNVQKS